MEPGENELEVREEGLEICTVTEAEEAAYATSTRRLVIGATVDGEKAASSDGAEAALSGVDGHAEPVQRKILVEEYEKCSS